MKGMSLKGAFTSASVISILHSDRHVKLSIKVTS